LIVHSSVVASIFLRQPGHERLIDVLAGSRRAGIGAATLAEVNCELARATGRDVQGLVARFVQEFDLAVIPFSAAHARAAAEAYRLYGEAKKRRGLGFGDCLTYAIARVARQPLLTADAKFGGTDLELA